MIKLRFKCILTNNCFYIKKKMEELFSLYLFISTIWLLQVHRAWRKFLQECSKWRHQDYWPWWTEVHAWYYSYSELYKSTYLSQPVSLYLSNLYLVWHVRCWYCLYTLICKIRSYPIPMSENQWQETSI